MRIAIDARWIFPQISGIGAHTRELIRHLAREDHENNYLLFFSDRLLAERTWLEADLVDKPNFRPEIIPSGVFSPRSQMMLPLHLIRRKVQVFHSTNYMIPLASFPRERMGSVRCVVTIHDLAFRVLPEHYGWQHRIYYGWQVSRSLRMADVIVADSHNTRRDIIRFYQVPAEKIEVVHLGVAEQFFATAETRPPRVVAEKYFLSITTHPKRKNVLGALKAFALFARQSDVQYVVVGLMGEPQRQELLALAGELGIRDKVSLFGYADDSQLVSLYQNAEFTLYPSFYEGFGLPVVEAMACGCPVIASNTSSLPEIMPDGEWLVDPHDIADIAARMQRMLSLAPEARRLIAEKNQRRAREFTWEKAAVRMRKIFLALQNRTAGGAKF